MSLEKAIQVLREAPDDILEEAVRQLSRRDRALLEAKLAQLNVAHLRKLVDDLFDFAAECPPYVDEYFRDKWGLTPEALEMLKKRATELGCLKRLTEAQKEETEDVRATALREDHNGQPEPGGRALDDDGAAIPT